LVIALKNDFSAPNYRKCEDFFSILKRSQKLHLYKCVFFNVWIYIPFFTEWSTEQKLRIFSNPGQEFTKLQGGVKKIYYLLDNSVRDTV